MPNNNTVEQQLFSTREAARYLGLSEIALRKLRHEGALPGRRDPIPYIHLGGKTVRYRRADLDAYITAHVVTPKTWKQIEEGGAAV